MTSLFKIFSYSLHGTVRAVCGDGRLGRFSAVGCLGRPSNVDCSICGVRIVVTITFEVYDGRDVLFERYVVGGVDTAGTASVVALFISYNENSGQ